MGASVLLGNGSIDVFDNNIDGDIQYFLWDWYPVCVCGGGGGGASGCVRACVIQIQILIGFWSYKGRLDVMGSHARNT